MPDPKIKQNSSDILDTLKRFFLPRPKPDYMVDTDFEVPPPATPFIPEPLVVGGGQRAAQSVHEMFNKFPDAKRHVSQVDFLPDGWIADQLKDSGFAPEEWPKTGLLGVTNTRTGKVSVNPRMTKEPNNWIFNTLMHEFSHAAGANEDLAGERGNLYQELLNRALKK